MEYPRELCCIQRLAWEYNRALHKNHFFHLQNYLFDVFPASFIVCFVSINVWPQSKQNSMRACCNVRYVCVAFSDVFNVMSFESPLLVKNNFKWRMNVRFIRLHYNRRLWSYEKKIQTISIHIYLLNNKVWIIFIRVHQ